MWNLLWVWTPICTDWLKKDWTYVNNLPLLKTIMYRVALFRIWSGFWNHWEIIQSSSHYGDTTESWVWNLLVIGIKYSGCWVEPSSHEGTNIVIGVKKQNNISYCSGSFEYCNKIHCNKVVGIKSSSYPPGFWNDSSWGTGVTPLCRIIGVEPSSHWGGAQKSLG